jgi:hypothetical protein
MAERGKRTRKGVRLKTVPKVQIAISPETWRSRSTGFAPSWLVNAGIMRSQRPTQTRGARTAILLPKIPATSPREFVESGGDAGIGKAESRIQEWGRSVSAGPRLLETLIDRLVTEFWKKELIIDRPFLWPSPGF